MGSLFAFPSNGRAKGRFAPFGPQVISNVGRRRSNPRPFQVATNSLYSVEFFDLQLRFAAKVAEISGLSFADAVGNYTNIYVRLGLGHRLSLTNRDWLGYVAELIKVREPAKWTHTVHRQRLHLPIGPPPEETVGCFSYALAGQGCVRLHFSVGNHVIESPLSIANRPVRQHELASLLARLKESSGEDVRIVGASWLYNLGSYRRLFPEPYIASLQAVEHLYQRLPLWGQFLKRNRSVRPEAGASFLASVAKASSLGELASCFPLPILATTAPARWLYEHVGL